MLDLKKLFDKILTKLSDLQNNFNNYYTKTQIDSSLATKVNKTGDTMTGQLKTSFKNSVAMGSYQATSTSIEDLLEEVRFSSGCSGSVNITTVYNNIGTGWYNFMYIPHRSGGINGTASGDNCNYGNLWLFSMTTNNGVWRIRYSSSAITSVEYLGEKGYAFQRYTEATTLSTAGQTISFNVTITTHGRPVVIIATSTWNGTSNGGWASIYISRGSTVLQQATMVSSSASFNVPGAIMALETLAAGTYTYTCTLYLGSGSGTFSENNGGRSEAPSLVAFEI